MDLTDQRAVVTGGAGTIGSHVVDQLLDAGAREVVVIDDLSRGRVENLSEALGRAPEKVRLVEGDIRDVPLVKKTIEGADLVFHLAALRITRCAAEPRVALEVLVDGTFNVVEASVEAGVKKVVASSTASVYGLAEEFPTTERHHPYNNDTFYGAAKVFNEGMLRSFKAMHGLDYVALRYFNPIGADPLMRTGLQLANPSHVLGKLSEAYRTGTPFRVTGVDWPTRDGSAIRDYIHVWDLALAHIAALRRFDEVVPADGDPYQV
ncbi:SDR family NAD(P)-dependent oxidoreductase, partial [Saccharothrix sp. MB29]|nr:SDR family NAD(P)-dependent oxidoreductase [Saccharothrix sp. MB29]